MKFVTSPLIKFGTTAFAIGLFLIAGNTFAASTSDIPSSFSFQKTLYPNNNYDPDVKYLQLLLNSDSRTMVSTVGPGSNDAPTIYYGNKTKDAVNRFQTLYKDEILTPAGLTAPTGIVGANTRAKLNQILSSLFSGSPLTGGQNTSNTQNNQNSNSSGGFVFVVEGANDVTEGTQTPPPSTTVNNNDSTGTTDSEYQTTTTTTDSIQPSPLAVSSGSTQKTTTTNTSQKTSGSSNTASSTSSSSTGSNTSSNNSSSGSGSGSAATAAGAGAAVSIGSSLLSGSGSGSVVGSGTGVQYFGGRITMVTYCTCSASILLDIQDYTRGYVSVLYTPGVSRLYANYQVFSPGPSVIGGYVSGGTCQVYSGTQCNSQGSPMGTINTIHGIGTSAQ